MRDAAVVDLGSQAGKDLAGDDHPRQQARDELRQAHPHRGCGDLSHEAEQVVVGGTERRLGDPEPAVVVRHVAGVVRHPRHREQISVVGGVRAEDVPPDEHTTDDSVEQPRAEPADGQETPGSTTVEDVHPVQRPQCDREQHQAREHRDVLQGARRGGEAGVDLDVGRQALIDESTGCGPVAVQLRVDAGQLGPLVTGDGSAVLLTVRASGTVDPDRGLLLCGGDVEHGIPGERLESFGVEFERYLVADDDVETRGGEPDEQSARGRVLTVGGQGTEDGRLVLAQFRERGHRDVDVDGLGHIADQRRVDAVQRVVLWPVEGGLGLGDRHERREHEHEETQDTTDYGEVEQPSRRGGRGINGCC